MFPVQKTVLVGIIVLSIIASMVYLSDDENYDYDYSGIVHGISKTKNGYTFYLDTFEESILCYNSDEPVELGHYKIIGSYSNNGSMYFISKMYYVDDIR